MIQWDDNSAPYPEGADLGDDGEDELYNPISYERDMYEPDGWEDDVSAIVDTIESRVDDYDQLLTGQPIFRERTEGVGVMGPELALAMSASGPLLRAAGVPWDLRKTLPYLYYDQVEFDVIVGTVGDTFDRYAVRLNEVRESL